MISLTTAPRSPWLIPAALVLLSLVPAAAGTVRLGELAGQPEITAANERFVAMPVPVVLHLLAVIPFSILGAFQFSAGLRRRHRTWHRTAGKLLIVLGLVTALTGLWMTLAYPWANNDGVAVFVMRLLVGTAMTMSIVLSIDAIRRRDFTAHGEWMIRGYAIGMGAGTQVLTHLPWFILFGQPAELSRAVLMGSAWAINIVAAEWIIRSSRAKRTRMPRAAAAPRERLLEVHHAT